MARLFTDQLAKLEREIDAAADDSGALSRGQRKVEEAVMLSGRLTVERHEVAGTIIDFRPTPRRKRRAAG